MICKQTIIFYFFLALWISTPALAQVEVSKRLGYIQNYPCDSCHNNIEMDQKKTGNHQLPASHSMVEFKHMEEPVECWFCHNSKEPNTLRTLNNRVLTFDESSQLCIQCHGSKGRDWKLAIHGKQVGSWNGAKTRFACVSCHNPHNPKYKKEHALKGPVFPRFGIRKNEEPIEIKNK